jgi:branched-chain amino acid transport system substrate-binding protein
MRRALLALASLLLIPAAACGGGPKPIVVGAVYPLEGGQGVGGREELHGMQVAADLVNQDGGVHGRPIELRLAEADSFDAAPGAVQGLVSKDVRLIVGSYGSVISAPAAAEASRLGALFWEGGAVGTLEPDTAAGDLVFRFAPTGESLGKAAVEFVEDQLLPKLGHGPDVRWSVAYVKDAYGGSVGMGALDEIQRAGLTLAGQFPYDPRTANFDDLARQIAAVHTDVLVVSAYLDDGIALRRATVSQRVPLVASVGTSSSYCMPAFGQTLGQDAVGLFASDKPDEEVLDPASLGPEAAALLQRAGALYRQRYGTEMTAAALAGFSAGWALFHHVLPAAADLSPVAVGVAARATKLPVGTFPNGSGMDFAGPGARAAGSNLRAVSVIEEWIRPGVRAVVWPPAFATDPILAVPLS